MEISSIKRANYATEKKSTEKLVCNNREILNAARDKFCEEIDISKCLEHDGNEKELRKRIIALLGDQ